MENDIDVYDYTDGIFLGRYNTEAYAGEASYGVGSDPLTTPPDDIPTADLAYRVDTQFYNSLYVTDVNKKFVKPRTTDISKNLLIHAYNTLQDQTGKNITRTKIIDENNVEHNALDVCDFSGVDYLSTIYNKFFNPDKAFVYGEGPYIDVFTDRLSSTFYWYDNKWADDYSGTQLGFGNDYTDSSGIFSSMYNSNQKLRQLMTYDYSANKKYLQLYDTFMTYTTTQQLTNPITQPDIDYGNNNAKLSLITSQFNSINLTERKTNSISFYGTVNKPCKISVVYIYFIQAGEGSSYISEQTQYDMAIKKSGTIKFGFNVDKISAQYVTLIYRDINTNQIIKNNDQTFNPIVHASYSYKKTTNLY